jgi:hypothetical protein
MRERDREKERDRLNIYIYIYRERVLIYIYTKYIYIERDLIFNVLTLQMCRFVQTNNLLSKHINLLLILYAKSRYFV